MAGFDFSTEQMFALQFRNMEPIETKGKKGFRIPDTVPWWRQVGTIKQ